MFDYGSPEENAKKYGGLESPPFYPIEKIRDFPIAIIFGKSDTLAAPADCFRLKLMLEE